MTPVALSDLDNLLRTVRPPTYVGSRASRPTEASASTPSPPAALRPVSVLPQECTRVLKPGGFIVVSFLELSLPCHWPTFDLTYCSCKIPHPTTAFVERSVMDCWAAHLCLEPIRYVAPDEPFADGMEILDQSVMVLGKY